MALSVLAMNGCCRSVVHVGRSFDSYLKHSERNALAVSEAASGKWGPAVAREIAWSAVHLFSKLGHACCVDSINVNFSNAT